MSELQSSKTGRGGENQTTSPINAKEKGSDKLQKHRELKSENEDVESRDIPSFATTDNAPSLRATDLLDNLKVATNIDVKEKIEIARLQMESERIEVERMKSLADQRFWAKNFGASITAIISLAAVLVSLSQVWVASIQKDKELAIAQAQKDKEIDLNRTQKEKEFATVIVQQDRAWKLDMAKFVLDHGDKLLGKDKAQRELITRVMLTTFPSEYSAEIIDRLEAVTDSPEVKHELQNIRSTILPKIKEKGDSEQARVINNRWLLLERLGLGTAPRLNLFGPNGGFGGPDRYKYTGEPTPSPSIIPTPSPPHSCRCPPPFEGGIDCGGWDDMAICEVINGKCVTRCFVPH
jgi:hypothetical protein